MTAKTATESILAILFLVVTILGLLGNVTAFVVFSRARFKATMFSVYFRFQIAAESYVIANACFEFLYYQVYHFACSKSELTYVRNVSAVGSLPNV